MVNQTNELNTPSVNNERGATLIYALIVITILIFIGVALSSYALMSVRIAQMDNTSDKAFYLSDAAIEETLYKLNAISQNAEAESTDWIQNKSNYYSQEKWLVFTTKLERDVANGDISQAESVEFLKRATEWEYNKRYNYCLLGKPSPYNDTAAWLTQDYNLVVNDVYATANTIKFNDALTLGTDYLTQLNTVTLNPADYSSILKTYNATGKPVVSVTSKYKDNKCEVAITSNGAYNSTHKQIDMLITMEPPVYTQVIESKSEKLTPNRNQLIENAVTAGGNILVSDVKDGNVASGAVTQIVGQTYAYGYFPESNLYRLPSLGGVLVGYDSASPVLDAGIGPYTEAELSGSGTLNVKTGDLVTRSAVQLMNNNSVLNVDGSLYANGLVVSKFSDKTSTAVGKDLVLIEDLLVNGTDPLINVGKSSDLTSGTIWGLMDLGNSKTLNTLKSDISSSIIINTDSPNTKINCNYVKVAGVAYYNVYRSVTEGSTTYQKAYQTGESFTTNNQSWYYQTQVPETAVRTGYVDYKLYGNGEYPDDSLDVVNVGLIEYLDDANKPIEDVKFKSEHFMLVGQKNPGSVDSRDRQIMNIRSINAVQNPSTLEYTISGLYKNYGLGILIANNLVFNPYYSNEGEVDANNDPVQFMLGTQFANQSKTVLAQFDEKTHLLKTRNLATMTNTDPSSVSNRFDTLTNAAHSYVNTTNPKNFAIVTPNSTANVYINIPASEKAVIASKDTNTPVFIDAIPTDFGASKKSMSGLVVTKGNIFVYNEGSPLDFKGTLVSDQNVVFMGSGDKTIQFDPQVVYQWVSKQSDINQALYGSEGRQVTIKKTADNSQLTSSYQQNLSLQAEPYAEKISIALKGAPVYEGALKQPSDFSFKIQKWSVGH